MRVAELTDEEAIRIARNSPYGSVVVIPNGTARYPMAEIRVDLSQRPPTVERIDDPYPNLNAKK